MQDLYQLVTDRIVAALEAGTPPWVRPWNAATDPVPMNAETRRLYRGVNFLTLAIEAQTRGYTRNCWLTYRQATALGAQVRKGEHGTPVVFWKLRTVNTKADDRARRSRCCAAIPYSTRRRSTACHAPWRSRCRAFPLGRATTSRSC